MREAERAFSASVSAGLAGAWGVERVARGVAKRVRKALSAAKIKVSAFMMRSLALLLFASNE
jgi:hypothetical protein